MEIHGKKAENTSTGPLVAISACLLSSCSRWDGKPLHFDDDFRERISLLEKHVKIIPVCPETGIGLGVPREPIRLVTNAGGVRLIQPSSGRDLTARIFEFTSAFLQKTGHPQAYILKERSPSCAPSDSEIYTSIHATESKSKGEGMFIRALLGNTPQPAIIENEEVLKSNCAFNEFLDDVLRFC